MPVHETTITSKGQLYLSKEIREALGLRPRDRVRIETEGDRVSICRVLQTERSILDRYGRFSIPGDIRTLEDLREEFEEGVARDAFAPIERAKSDS